MPGTADNRSELLSLEEFEHLPSDDGYRDELVRGRLVREPSPASRHGWLQFRIAAALGGFAERN
ncbi:MAG: hypothetical protein ACREKM_01565, partial [Longimicrobiales bacterium]